MNIYTLMIGEARRKMLSSVLIFILSFVCTLGLALSVVLAYNGRQWSLELLGLGNESLQLTVLPAEALHIMGIGISKPHLDDDDISFLRNDPDVEAVHLIHAIPIPATIHIKIPHIADNKQLVTLIGLDRAVFSSSNDAAIIKQWDIPKDSLKDLSSHTIPIVINASIIRFYNLGMADRYDLPRIDPDFVIGLRFTMIWGADMFKREREAFTSEVIVVGFSDAVSPWDVGIPHAYGKQLLKLFHKNESNENPRPVDAMKLRVIAKSADRLKSLRQRIEKRRLRIPDMDPLIAIIHKTHHASVYIISVLMGIVATIVLLSLTSIISMICSERKRQIALYRQFGASFAQLTLIFLGGIACSLFSGVLCACLLVRLCTQSLLAPYLQQLGLLPHVAIPASLEISGLAVACVLCLASSLILWRMKRMDMLTLLRQNS